jgi:hypothetical protein
MKYLIILLLSVTIFSNPLNYINYLRKNSGAGFLKYSKTLEIAAQKHAKYLYFNKEFTHTEFMGKKYYYASMPWDRISKAGFLTKAVVENISFFEKNYKESINKLFGTIYHRFAFLDLKIDTIGFAKYKNIYVYEMSNAKLGELCKKSSGNGSLQDICKNNKSLNLKDFQNAIYKTEKKSKPYIFYPFNNQKNIGLNLVCEQPLLFSKNRGFGVTIEFNEAYYKSVKLISFSLFNKNRKVLADIVTKSNDVNRKLKKFQFALIPKKSLKRSSVYNVVIKAKLDGKLKVIKWRFATIN